MIIQDGYDHSCDWWSFGAMVYEMLTGAPPFFSKDRKEIIRNIIKVKQITNLEFKKPVPIPSYISDAARSLLQ